MEGSEEQQMGIAQIIGKMPEELRQVMYEFSEGLEDHLREKFAVRREDFNELRAALTEAQAKSDKRLERLESAVDQLVRAQARTDEQVAKLVEAQRKTEERLDRLETAVDQLVRAQARTDEQVAKLAEAQRKTEERLDRLEAAVEKLAEAQRKTEERLDRLEVSVHELGEAQKKTDKAVRELSCTVCAVGARWGYHTEDTFRNAISELLKDFADVTVEHVILRDTHGDVFGYPQNVEIDLLVRNGKTIFGEVKSSLSQGDLATFYKKMKFYEKTKKTSIDRAVVISPMVDPRAREAAERLGIDVFTSALDFENEIVEEKNDEAAR